jgi:uncharacterized protein YpuA (DUF1002 family)
MSVGAAALAGIAKALSITGDANVALEKRSL